MTNDIDSGQENKHKSRISSIPLMWAILWLGYGLAMLIWPDAYYFQPDYICDPDEAIECFLATSWGTPAGIVISLAVGLLWMKEAIRKR